MSKLWKKDFGKWGSRTYNLMCSFLFLFLFLFGGTCFFWAYSVSVIASGAFVYAVFLLVTSRAVCRVQGVVNTHVQKYLFAFVVSIVYALSIENKIWRPWNMLILSERSSGGYLLMVFDDARKLSFCYCDFCQSYFVVKTKPLKHYHNEL